MSARIRTFLTSDYAAARALWERTPGVGLSSADEPAAIERFLQRNPGLSFVAEIEDELIGTILCGHDGRRGLIHHLATSTEARRRGIARQLLAAGLRALRGEGIEKAHLLVIRGNAEGLAFWQAVQAQERVELALFSVLTWSPV
jgi:ribosomal protein S18 acetylase RimI-like enzyme